MLQTVLGLGGSILGTKLLQKFYDQKVNVISALPGRVRLQCDRWKDSETKKVVERILIQHPLVKSVHLADITGSLLLHFTRDSLSPDELDSIVKLAVNAAVSSYPQRKAELMEGYKKTLTGIDGQIKTRTMGKIDLNSALVTFLALRGIIGFSSNPAFSTSLLLWAYGLLNQER
ncbi:hypothetical protein NZD89_04290 [Alicyclobacillus fastidiosus]|uniref:Uncharacterized protein n=1 Tax=Alicyclobacillus fastidiosus TaxID=392011 RepID=A0ABY6ZJK0_9BACL|nr:hypothetical protein [Alicyclobacillus fastidiosus]WAH42667.1 hypothetical protein NZD89_04290 [Alicyclobacillus fastidiosus]GMA64548.1 hypothetical protein GCM10025859_49880 [Alicyclobacillus fastidiosus]